MFFKQVAVLIKQTRKTKRWILQTVESTQYIHFDKDIFSQQFPVGKQLFPPKLSDFVLLEWNTDYTGRLAFHTTSYLCRRLLAVYGNTPAPQGSWESVKIPSLSTEHFTVHFLLQLLLFWYPLHTHRIIWDVLGQSAELCFSSQRTCSQSGLNFPNDLPVC